MTLPGASSSAYDLDTLRIEPRLLAEFQTFLQEAPHLRLTKLTSTAYLQRCIAEDLEPALATLRRPSTKRIVEALLDNRCCIEALPAAPSAAVASSPPPPSGAAAIEAADRSNAQHALFSASMSGNLLDMLHRRDSALLDFGVERLEGSDAHCALCDAELAAADARFRVKFDESGAWRTIDRFCRDRLAGVGQFLTFVRYIKCVCRAGDVAQIIVANLLMPLWGGRISSARTLGWACSSTALQYLCTSRALACVGRSSTAVSGTASQSRSQGASSILPRLVLLRFKLCAPVCRCPRSRTWARAARRRRWRSLASARRSRPPRLCCSRICQRSCHSRKIRLGKVSYAQA